jgi:hypothetical protein
MSETDKRRVIVADHEPGHTSFRAPGIPYNERPALLDHAVSKWIRDHAVSKWIREHPNLDVLVALPIVAEGNTDAVHLWWTD